MEAPGYTDNELIRLIQKGDRAAFKELYHRYWSGLFKYAQKITANTSLAEDILQEIFVNLWERRKQKSIYNVKAYLFRAVKLQILKAYRDRKFESEFIDFYFENVWQETNIETTPKEIRLTKVIEQLPPKRKEIFFLNKFEGLSYKEIARELQISEHTVKNQISKALHFLKSKLNKTAIIFLLVFLV